MAASVGKFRCSGCLPLVVILGSTGTGKSKLAIEIGKRVGGEILSADSMQVYKGLDIITNKVTAEELSQCPHHLIDFVSPLKEFSVIEFRNMALPLIEDIKKRGKIPIIVGGTNYYIESVLWNTLLEEEGIVEETEDTTSGEESEGPTKVIKKRKQIQNLGASNSVQIVKEEGLGRKEESDTLDKEVTDVNTIQDSYGENIMDSKRISTNKRLVEMTSKVVTKQASDSEDVSRIGNDVSTTKSDGMNSRNLGLYEKLKEVDPAMAARLHPSDSRKIARSLQVFEQHGRKHSQILQEQREKLGGSSYGGPMRFRNTCVFWLQCQREILNERLDQRVDKMLERGLINELLDFHREYNHVLGKKDTKTCYTEGIFQSIGFKEFHEFLVRYKLRKFDKNSVSKQDKDLLTDCIENMKIVTRRYAKKQVTWVRNRFLARPAVSAPDVYGLDASDLENWDKNVLENALVILEKMMNGENPVVKPLSRIVIQDDRHARHVCEICDNRLILGEENWRKHLVSKSHKWHVKRERRKGQQ